jgi:hypothetical protein
VATVSNLDALQHCSLAHRNTQVDFPPSLAHRNKRNTRHPSPSSLLQFKHIQASLKGPLAAKIKQNSMSILAHTKISEGPDMLIAHAR